MTKKKNDVKKTIRNIYQIVDNWIKNYFIYFFPYKIIKMTSQISIEIL